MEKTSNKYQTLCICLGLALVTFIAFEQVLNNGFVNYDDPAYVTKNQNVLKGLTFDGIKWAFTTGHASNWHPLTWVSHMVDCQLFGADARWHHLVNLLLHTVNTLLLFAVLQSMTGAIWSSGFVAALFALHPLHVESVAWIAERKHILSTFFGILAIGAYAHYVKRPEASRYLLVFVLFALGLLAKPMLVALPFVLLLLDYWPLGRFERTGRVFYKLVWEKIPFFVLSVISSVITFLVQQRGGAVAGGDVIPVNMRIANIPVAYLRYIGKMIWPGRLAVFYPHPGGNLAAWQPIVAAIILIGISVLVIRLASKRRYLPVGWLWFLVTLVPLIGLVQVGLQGLADRYTYVPSIGIFIIVCWGVSELSAGWQYRKVVLGGCAAVILGVLLICTRMQVRYWRNDITLFGHAIEVTENNYIMHNNMGITLGAQGRVDEAISHFQRAVEIKPRYAEAHYNMGFAFKLQDRIDEAVGCFKKALKIKPEYVDAHNNLGLAFQSQGKMDEAIGHLRKAIEIEPDNYKAHYNLAQMFRLQGEFDEAIGHYRQALQINPNHTKSQHSLEQLLKDTK